MKRSLIQCFGHEQTQPGYTGKQRKRILGNHRGAAALEFALLLPVLATLIFGMIDFGRMLWYQEILVNATRDGVRLATLFDRNTSKTDIENSISAALTGSGLNPSNLNVVPTGLGGATGTAVTVYAEIDWSYLVVDKILPHGLTNNKLAAQVTMMNE